MWTGATDSFILLSKHPFFLFSPSNVSYIYTLKTVPFVEKQLFQKEIVKSRNVCHKVD